MRRFLKFTVLLCGIFILLFALSTVANASQSGTCGENVTWTLDDSGNLTISGNGAMKNYYSETSSIPWRVSRVDIVSITIENGVTSIGDWAFSYCRKLASMTIPDSVTSIGDSAFCECSSLTSVTIPDSVTSIGKSTFSGCSSLSNFNVDEKNQNYSSSEGVLFNKEKTILISYPQRKSDSIYIIPNSVTSIGDSAFYGCSSLTSVIIPDSVTSIGSFAFRGCSNLTSVTISDSVTSIGDSAFYGCSSLTSVTIGNGVTNIGNSAFDYCYSLTSVYITDLASWCNISFSASYSNPMSYADNLYVNNKLLTKLEIPDGVTEIKNYAFYKCSSLVSVTIPDSVTSIGDSAFYGCSSLVSVTIPDSVTSIGDLAFSGCAKPQKVYIEDLTAWCNIDFAAKTSIPFYYSGGSLYLNDELVEELTIPKDITTISANTFYNCDSIKSVEFHDDMEIIYGSAFYDCDNLTDVYFGKGISTVVTNAFYDCDKVENVYYAGSEDEWANVVIGSGNNCLSNTTVTFGTIITRTYTFVANGGSEVAPVEGAVEEMPVSTREGYEFLGWYDNEACEGEAITFPYNGKETTLYAKWKNPNEVIPATMEITSTEEIEGGYKVTVEIIVPEKADKPKLFFWDGNSLVPYCESIEIEVE